MNLFQKYGIKEVAAVTFYSITSIGDEIIYTPVLFLDTLKVSTVQKTGQKVSAEGGKGNKKLISWSFGKEITLQLEDALFSPASMSMIMNGNLKGKLSAYLSAIVKSNLANGYGKKHYSVKAYASPPMTEEEWNIVFNAATDGEIAVEGKKGDNNCWYLFTADSEQDEEKKAYIAENRVLLKKAYNYRTWNGSLKAMPQEIIDKVGTYIDEVNKIGTIQTSNYNVEVIDRQERCTVRNPKGLTISTNEQKKNLLRYYMNDKSSSYVIYYDAKTMMPLFHIENGKIQGWSSTEDDDVLFTLRPGTGYIKWERTVKYVDSDDEGTLGNVLVIDSDTFSGDYKIVCETYVKNQKTGNSQRYQITINRAQISSDTSITLQADGDPTTFNMSIDVLEPQNGDLMEMKQFDVEEDLVHGGTKVIPQNAQYTHTNTTKVDDPINDEIINNGEIF